MTRLYAFAKGHDETIKVPVRVLEDRDRRASAPRTLSMILCGDPPPGQSALDKREESQS